jgi:NAD(P)-dependent dehydrogenase (short-subunit alcohol dehydrogenase family)
MRLVVADVAAAPLAETVSVLERAGVAPIDVASVPCDVSRPADVEALAAGTWTRFGGAQLLFNNAGVATCGPVWTSTPEDWAWVLGVNLMGVVHGIRAFVPRMLESGLPAHIVNTASVAGFLSVPGSSVYCASKHAVVTVSECLAHELEIEKAPIGVSVIAPAYFNTGIVDSARNRPAELAATNTRSAPYEARLRRAVASGRLSAADIARLTLEAVKADRFYVYTHPAILPSVAQRAREVAEGLSPSNPMP